METELAVLASSGAATLVGLMVSDSWTMVKENLARFFARDGVAEDMVQQLDAHRGELIIARETGDRITEADIEAEWRARLRRLLQSDPAAGEELRRLLESLGSKPQAQPPGTVHNVVSGGLQFGPVIQSGRISGLVFHRPSIPADDGHLAEGEDET